MKILTLHCDYIRFKPIKKALKGAEEISEKERQKQEIKECLVVLTAVEKSDESSSDIVIKKLVENIKDIAKQVKTNNIVLYPYAHLSSNLANPSTAANVLEETASKLEKQFKITRAPFGYYKEFELKCKGHPLSELSREITAEGVKERKVKVEIKEEKIDYKRLLREISKSKLTREKLKENDHRILGQQMDLFSFSETAPGMVFWHNKGLIIKNQLINFWRQEHKKAGFKEIQTPQILDVKLWKISGHWEKFRDHLFLTKYENRDFGVKPMNCPGGILIYKTRKRSYKELPMRVGELGVVHRQELSGVLGGLFRVIQFTQDDAHIYCTEKQLEQELINVVELIDKFYKLFGFNYHVELSTKPKEYIGDDKLWGKAEKALEKVLKKLKMKFKINKREGAFYGPKIDFNIKDSLGRTWQCATLQLDFAMPERFGLTYVDEDNKEKRPIMLHKVIYGSLERFIGILLEHTNGRLPTWLAPIQSRIISLTSRNVQFSNKVLEILKQEGIRVDADLEDKTVQYKIREAEIQKIPYIIVIGDKEEKTNTLAVREKGKKPVFGIKIRKFIDKLKKDIENKK